MSIRKAVVKMSFILLKLKVGAVCLVGMTSSADVTVLRHHMQRVCGVWSMNISHAGTKYFIPTRARNLHLIINNQVRQTKFIFYYVLDDFK